MSCVIRPSNSGQILSSLGPRLAISLRQPPATAERAAAPVLRLSMRHANPAALVAFCAGLWVSNPAPAQGQQPVGLPGTGCEVCTEFLSRFYNSLIARRVTFSLDTIEKELINFCLDVKGKENRLCYYLGATKDAATKILSEVTRPMSVHMPSVKICEKLKKMDSQICDLKYGIKEPSIFPVQCVGKLRNMAPHCLKSQG